MYAHLDEADVAGLLEQLPAGERDYIGRQSRREARPIGITEIRKTNVRSRQRWIRPTRRGRGRECRNHHTR